MNHEKVDIDKVMALELVWTMTNNPELPYFCEFNNHELEVRINDYPAEPFYTLLKDNKVLCSFDSWPPLWKKIK
jgi:hypothetical protein